MALIVHEGSNTLLAGSSDGAAVAAPSLGRTGHGTLRRGCHSRFLVLHTVDRVPIATGDLLQVQRGGQIESRMVFCFTDWSLYDEAVVFTQERVFTLQSYHLVHRGPAFTEGRR